MNIPDLSNQSLQDLHTLIREALVSDDAAKDAKPYGVREYPDWKKQADEFEAEMTSRKISFNKIEWY
jgi:hypothetical protein